MLLATATDKRVVLESASGEMLIANVGNKRV